MTVQNGSKINRLGRELPEGLLVDAQWLERRGYYRSLRSQYVSSGWLEQPARGVFRRPRGVVSWEQVVISLQTLMRFPISVGGRTALDMQGYAHYLRQSVKAVHVYADKKLPAWTSKLGIAQSFECHNRLRLLPQVSYQASKNTPLEISDMDNKAALESGLRIEQWGQWKWPLLISAPERAILEMLDELPSNESFHIADVTMEGLVNLRPRYMQHLLENTKSIKVKRLFFFFTERQGHAWLGRIDRSKIDLGSGKRVLVKGGKLDPTYQITVPEDLSGVQ